MGSGRAIRRAFAKAVVRPYVRAELPAWRRVFNLFVGGYASNAAWADAGQVWMRGKLHGYLMHLDLAKWPDRNAYFLGRYYELETQAALLLLLRPGDTFVDVGANEGMLSLVAAHAVGPGGRVVAFEPNPAPRAALEAAIARNGIRHIDLRAKGLADEAGELELHIPLVNDGEGSFGRPDYAGAEVRTITCPVRVGDEELGDLAPAIIKIDVEGFETRVVRGFSTTLERHRPVLITEVVDQHLANAGSSAAELRTLLEGLGYRAMAMSTRRRGLRHRLRLTAAAPGEGYNGDVLWLHSEDVARAALLAPYTT